MSPLIAPSVLSADLTRLGDEVRLVEQAGADWIHVDVMDGSFVPNITFGPAVVGALRRVTKLPLDVHLMIREPERHIEAFVAAGANYVCVHVEACTHLQRTLARIRELGAKAGAVMNPSTHESTLDYVMEDLDLILVMSVNPGFGGQSFIPSQLRKLESLAARIGQRGLGIQLEVDGGISPRTARQVTDAGATVLVAGTAVFGEPDRKAAIAALRAAAHSG
ncbi:MAG TPA: ribulose-phosphate 3-epimerase [Polyangiaceae bacterium]|jgi:ribulose-phosphate 3-epimerase|nr:ribulose-phosphate 3-epimerase [Polyangiaceae bacterium]